MTVIFAAALSDCAVIGADSKSTDVEAGVAWSIDKIRKVSSRIAAAKFGYGGPEGNRIWTELLALPEEVRQDVAQMLPAAKRIGQPIYEERRKTFSELGLGDYGITLLFASFDVSLGSGIHWIDFKNGGQPVSHWRPTGSHIVAQGPPGSQQVATASAGAHLITLGSQTNLKIASWSADVVSKVSAMDPDQTCGPPARYRIVDVLGVSEPRLAENPISFTDMRPL